MIIKTFPFSFVDPKEQFQWQVSENGSPIGDVRKLGTGLWLTCCPLCGRAHDVTSVQGDVYQPTCTLKATHPAVFAEWQQKYPDAALHTTIHLRKVG